MTKTVDFTNGIAGGGGGGNTTVDTSGIITAIQDTTESDETQAALASVLNELQILNAPTGTLTPQSTTLNTSSTIPAGNELVIVHNTGNADIAINGVTFAPGSYFTREVTESTLPSYVITASDSYEISVEYLAGQGGIPTTLPA